MSVELGLSLHGKNAEGDCEQGAEENIWRENEEDCIMRSFVTLYAGVPFS